jgi:hypothetical protein
VKVTTIGAQAESGVTRKRVCGNGKTVIEKVRGMPAQEIPPLVNSGVTVTVAVIGAAVPFVAVKEGTRPVPVAANPIAGLEFVQA